MSRYTEKDAEAERRVLERLQRHGPVNLVALCALTGLSVWRARGALQRLEGRMLVGKRRLSKAEGEGRSFLLFRAIPERRAAGAGS